MTRYGLLPVRTADVRGPTAPAPAPPQRGPGRWAARLSLLLVLLGVAVRVRQWAAGRSLWMDEALLAPSLIAYDHLRLLTEPLLHNQAAPQGWLHATRLSVELLGDGERALRLVPLLAGCATLLLLWRVSARLLPAALVPVAVGLGALHPELVRYAHELKPYSTDALVVLALVLVALRDRPLQLGLAGAVAVWSSYPSVFVLAGASLLLVLRRPTLPARARAALQLAPWPASLAVAWWTVLASVGDRPVFDLYWAYAFPRSGADLPGWLVRRGDALAEDPLRLAVPLLALGLLALGAVRLALHDRFGTGLVLAAVPPAVVAGALSAYPLDGRLVLWLVPLVVVLLAGALPARPGLPLVVVAVALAVTTGPAIARTLPLAVRADQVEELRPVLEQVADQRQAGDLVIVDIAAKAAFDHYGPRVGLPRSGVVLFAPPPPGAGCGEDLVALRTGRFGNGRVWLVRSHELVDGPVLGDRADLLGRIGDVTRLVRRVRAPGAEALLLAPGPGGRNIPAAPLTPGRCLAVHRSAG